jgi:ATP-dependent DNA ligase
MTGTCANSRSSSGRKFSAISCLRNRDRFLLAKHVPQLGRDLFAAQCEQGLEGIVAKWNYNPAALPLSWLKVKNLDYSQAGDRHELFATAPWRVGNRVVESAA